MKLNSNPPPASSFLRKGKLELYVKVDKGTVKSFEATVGGRTKNFKVVNGNFLAAWNKFEAHLKTIK